MHLFTKFGQMISDQQTGTDKGEEATKPFQKLMVRVPDALP